jgi:hypothetical protein
MTSRQRRGDAGDVGPPIVGDPDKPKHEPMSEHPSPTAGDNGDTERPAGPVPAPKPFGSA